MMKQLKLIKRFFAVFLAMVMVLMIAMPAQAGSTGAAAAQPLTFTMSAPAGRVNSGDYVTFRAKGGTSGTYWLRMDVDGLDTVTYEMPGGVLQLRTGDMDHLERGRDLPFGVHFKIHVLRVDNFNNIWEESADQTLDVVYPTSSRYTLKAKGAQRLYSSYVPNRKQWALDETPVLYKDGKAYLGPEELGAVYRYSIRTEKDQVEVSTDGMIEDVGYYDVDTYVYFKDPDTGRIIGVKADTVKAKIISPQINIDPGKLDGGSFVISTAYDGKAHGISASQISLNGISRDEYSVSFRYPTASGAWKQSATAPTYVKAGTYPMYVDVTFPTSKLVKPSAKVTLKIEDKAAKTPAKNPTKKSAAVKTPAKESKKSAAKVTVGKVTKVKLTAKKSKKAALKFQKVKMASGYQILYSTDKKFKKKVKKLNVTKNQTTLKNLKKGTYYVKVRAYKKVSSKKKVYGKYSSAVKVKIR